MLIDATEQQYNIVMKTLIFTLLFIFSGLCAVGSLLQIDLLGCAFWSFVCYVAHKFAFGK